MKRYQIAILSVALGIFFITSLAIYLGRRAGYEPDPQIETKEEFRTIQVFFSNSQNDPQMINCEATYPVERVVSRMTDNEKSALGEFVYLAVADLLKGPTVYEKDRGFFTSVNEGTKVQRIVIENGVAIVDFNNVLNEGVAGSCRVQAIRSQIERTLKQFPEITEVVISVNGESAEILQP